MLLCMQDDQNLAGQVRALKQDRSMLMLELLKVQQIQQVRLQICSESVAQLSVPLSDFHFANLFKSGRPLRAVAQGISPVAPGRWTGA